jgi:hypothetical protein
MPYLTHLEYEDMTFVSIEVTEFDRLVDRASDVLDSITRSFYQFNDIENDVPFRRDKFKKAVASQVEYFHEMGATTSQGLNEPQSVSIGRTTVSVGNASQGTNNLICSEVFMYLRDTGLLYRGLVVV